MHRSAHFRSRLLHSLGRCFRACTRTARQLRLGKGFRRLRPPRSGILSVAGPRLRCRSLVRSCAKNPYRSLALTHCPSTGPSVFPSLFTFLSMTLHSMAGGWTPCCRFTPSCSEYAAEAVRRFGWGKGLILTARRLCKCRPGAHWGTDPVPHLNLESST